MRAILRALPVVCAIVLGIAALARAVLHLRDLHGIQHIAGIWMALAQYGNAGVLYPPLEADGVYAGTRYMPLCFGLIAGLVRIVGDYVLAAKLMALVSMAALLGGVFVAVRRVTGRATDAVILTALVLASAEGRAALESPHADALAAAFAVWGLLLTECRMQNAECRMKSVASHSAFCILHSALFAAALMTKFSALAGPATAVAFLLPRDRRCAVALLVPWLVLSAAGLALLEYASDGRFLDNFRSLGSGGMTLDSIRIGPSRVAFALGQALPYSALFAVALFAVVRPGREGRLGLWDWYFLATAAITLVIFTSPGTGLNHLLELEVAAGLAIAPLLARRADAAPANSLAAPLARLFVFAVLASGAYEVIREAESPASVSGRAVVEAIPSGASILAEDATVPVLLGRRPIVMDAFAYRVLAEHGRVDDRALAERIARREFDVLVLMGRVDRPGESLCPRFHFGPRVTAAMLEAYRFDREVGPYYLFVPCSRDVRPVAATRRNQNCN
jgi:hypothetical protein